MNKTECVICEILLAYTQLKTVQRQYGLFGIWRQQKCFKEGRPKTGRTPVWNIPQVNSSHVRVRMCWGSRDCMEDIKKINKLKKKKKWARWEKKMLGLQSVFTQRANFLALDALGLKVRIHGPMLHWFFHSFLQNVICESLSFIEARCYITGKPP